MYTVSTCECTYCEIKCNPIPNLYINQLKEGILFEVNALAKQWMPWVILAHCHAFLFFVAMWSMLYSFCGAFCNTGVLTCTHIQKRQTPPMFTRLLVSVSDHTPTVCSLTVWCILQHESGKLFVFFIFCQAVFWLVSFTDLPGVRAQNEFCPETKMCLQSSGLIQWEQNEIITGHLTTLVSFWSTYYQVK